MNRRAGFTAPEKRLEEIWKEAICEFDDSRDLIEKNWADDNEEPLGS